MSIHTNFHVLPARPQDLSIVVEMIRELAEYERRPDEVTLEIEDLQDALFGSPPRVEAVIAWAANQQPAGFALWFHSFSTFRGRPNLYIEDLFVRPAWRQQGAGRALVAELARIAIERHCGRLEWSVLTWNEPAIEFYRRLGALPVTDWAVYELSGPALVKLVK
jgi:GNAT superfamily N-acetyltransferase